MISVIVPAYNSAAFIADTLRSVLDQTYDRFEILVVDDGSTDTTRQVVEGMQALDARIHYLYQPNAGVSAARNAGIRKAQGDYLSFLDSDDRWKPEFLEKMIGAITSGDYRVCYTGYTEYRGSWQTSYPLRFDVPDPVAAKLTDDGFRTSTNSWLIERRLLIDHGLFFTEGCHLVEDFEFFVKVLFCAAPKVTYVPRYLDEYHFRPRSLSGRTTLVLDAGTLLGVIDVYRRLFDWLAASGGERYLDAVRIRMRKSYATYLWDTLLLGNRTDFARLKEAYGRDDKRYGLHHVKLPGRKYRIWETGTSSIPARWVCRVFFGPYKYFKRKIKVSAIGR